MPGLKRLYMFYEIYQNSGSRNCNQIKKNKQKKTGPGYSKAR